MNQTTETLNREIAKTERLLIAADRRDSESWDKPEHVQRRIRATVTKHQARITVLQAQLNR